MKMNTKKRAFSAITEKSARILHRVLPFARERGYDAVMFQGGWVNRRFVLVGGSGRAEVPSPPSDPVALALTVPATLDSPSLMKTLRSFGATVERLWRDKEKGRFDLVVSDDDKHRHWVHKYHHIALCGHRSSAWLSDDEVGAFASQVQECPGCVTAAAAKPIHRVRWHPSATNTPASP